MYGMQGGLLSDNAWRYVLKEPEESVRAACGLRASVSRLEKPSRRIGAESRAASTARRELKLLYSRSFLITSIIFFMVRLRSRELGQSKTFERALQMKNKLKLSQEFAASSSPCVSCTHQYETLLKCSVKWLSAGQKSSLCSLAHNRSSAGSSCRNSSASSNVIC